ncbi:MAG: ATP-binding protein [Actinomycetota bacterium]
MNAPPIRVVIADDTPDIRLLLRAALSREGGFEVVGEAGDGAEAIRVAAETAPDAMILDLAMPAVDGLQAIPQILQVSPSTRIMVMSAFTRSGMQAEALAAGAHAYIEKGEPLDAIIAGLRGICGREAAPGGIAATRGIDEIPQQVLSVLAHELSSPAAVIRGFAETLRSQREVLSGAEIDDYVGAILRGAQQLTALIAAFIDARGVDSDTLDLEPVETDLGEYVALVAGDVRPQTNRHRLCVDVATNVVLKVDRVRLRQVLVNLITNAVKFSPPGSDVDVRVEVVDGFAELSVRDHGAGVPTDKADRLFRKFSQLRRGTPGVGLGLYISQGIARAHNGDLHYEPAPDGGSRFVLRLPL